ncbi:UPF0149 family protein [Pseudoalteromonas xiamenensis]
MYTFTYSDVEQQLIVQVLDAIHSPYTIDFVEGYLFADVCGPEGQEPEQWLARFGFSAGQLDEQSVFAFMALHHHVSETVYSEQGYAPFTLSAFDLKKIHQWSLGFLDGVGVYADVLSNATGQAQEMLEALQVSIEQLGFFALPQSQIEQFCLAHDLEFNSFVIEQFALLQEFSREFANLIEAAAQILFDD